MRRLAAAFTALLCSASLLFAQNEEFAGAEWIALEPDATILFPHVHLLKENSAQGRSLRTYRLPVLERSFTLDRGSIRRAWVDVCGLGQYELFLNGAKVGDHFLDPGWTMYDKTLYYNTFDIKDMLKSADGTVNIKVMLGGGMYDIPLKGYHKMAGSAGAPKLLLALHIEYAGGKKQTIVSDASWTARESPVRYSSIYGGEHYDATFGPTAQPVVITKPRWDARLVRQDDGTRLSVKRAYPMHCLQGSSIFDAQQNLSGIVRMTVRGKRGDQVTLRPAELIKGKDRPAAQWTVNQGYYPDYSWTYTLSGDPEGETWQPQFTYTGFRYVEIQATPGVEILELTALHTSSAVEETGRFACSDELLNNIFHLIDMAVSSNMASITTDCPTREKLGWQEQNHLMAHAMMYRYDMHALMNKIADDLADSQHADGAIPTIAPEYTVFELNSGFEDTPEWGASFILCPWYTYLWYGDDAAIRKHYDAMKKYIGYLQGRTQNGILDYGLGDWFDIGPARPGKAQLTSVALSATAMYHYELCTMAGIAATLGRTDDADRFKAMAADVKKAFNDRFWNASEHKYEQGSQTASAMALYMGLVTDENRSEVLETLVNDITSRISSAKEGEAIATAGDVGFRYVLQALFQGGRSDVVWDMNRRDDVPGYAWQIRQGATALTESWQAYDNVSNNHLMLGHLMEWLFQAPGGIRQAEGSVAWKHIVIDPQMIGSLTWAETSLKSPQGLVVCKWTASSSRTRWTLDVTIPRGADAEIHLPDGTVRQVKSGRHAFSSGSGKSGR